jgi:hypothetical protein
MNDCAFDKMQHANDNYAEGLSPPSDIHPLALSAAREMMKAHDPQRPLVIESWGTPKIVYKEVEEKLIAYGFELGVAREMTEQLVHHAIHSSESFRQRIGSDIIAVKFAIADTPPPPQFSSGHIEVQRIDGKSHKPQVFSTMPTKRR